MKMLCGLPPALVAAIVTAATTPAVAAVNAFSVGCRFAACLLAPDIVDARSVLDRKLLQLFLDIKQAEAGFRVVGSNFACKQPRGFYCAAFLINYQYLLVLRVPDVPFCINKTGIESANWRWSNLDRLG